MRDLEKFGNECIAELKAINVPISNVCRWTINTRAKARWGQCEMLVKNSQYHIDISATLLKESVPEKALKTVVIHELLHTIPGGHGHTGNWKKYADYVTRKLDVTIKRTDTAEELGIPTAEHTPRVIDRSKHLLECSKCKKQFHYARAVYAVQHPDRCFCPYCNTHTIVKIF